MEPETIEVYLMKDEDVREMLIETKCYVSDLSAALGKQLSVEAKNILLFVPGSVTPLDSQKTIQGLVRDGVLFNGVTLHYKVVRSLANPVDRQSNFISTIMNNPMTETLLKDPKTLTTFMANDPRFSKILKDNPQLSEVLQNKSFMNEFAELAKNPASLQEMLRNSDNQLSNIEAMPGGHAQLRQAYASMQKPMEKALSSFLNPSSKEDEIVARQKELHQQEKNSEEEGGFLRRKFPAPRRELSSLKKLGSGSKGGNVFNTLLGLNNDRQVQERLNEDSGNNEQISKLNEERKQNEFLKNLEILVKQRNPDLVDNYGRRLFETQKLNWECMDEANKALFEAENKERLQELLTLGFTDVAQNLQTLYECNINLERAVETLLKLN